MAWKPTHNCGKQTCGVNREVLEAPLWSVLGSSQSFLLFNNSQNNMLNRRWYRGAMMRREKGTNNLLATCKCLLRWKLHSQPRITYLVFFAIFRVSMIIYVLYIPFPHKSSRVFNQDSWWRVRSGGSGIPGGLWWRVTSQDFFGIINSDCSKSTKSLTTTVGGSAGVVGGTFLTWNSMADVNSPWKEFSWIWYAAPPRSMNRWQINLWTQWCKLQCMLMLTSNRQ